MKKIFSILTISVVIAAQALLPACGSDDPTILPELQPLPDTEAGGETTTPGTEPVPGSTDKIVVSYVTSWSSHTVNPDYMTHINYAFGHVNGDFQSVRIDNTSRLQTVVALKKNAPHLKVMLSIGGWGSGNFSEMAADENNRKAFAASCKSTIDQYDLDGIDIDWEFPTSNSAGISSSPDDTKNYTLLMRDIREAIGDSKLLTLASVCSADYINFADIMPYVDFVNIMAYDMNNPPSHNAPLYKSSKSGWYNCDAAVKAHLDRGVPASKLVLGMPFYGHGISPYDSFTNYRDVYVPTGFKDNWDDEAKVPYITNAEGKFVLSYDNARSIGIKCDYILEHELLGAMYWDDAGDDDRGTLHEAITKKLFTKTN